MKDIYLHLGFPKTGSSLLQEKIFVNIKSIRTWETFYNHKDKEMRKLIDYIREPKNPFNAEQMKKDFYSLLDKDKPNLITCELFALDMLQKEITKYETASRLKQVFPDAKVIICLREKQSILRSLYGHHVRSGSTLTYEKFIEEFDMEELNYDKYIKHLNSLFKTVVVVNFETLRKNHREFVKSFCDFLNADVPEYTNEQVNKHLTPKQVKIQRFTNHLFKTHLNPKGIIPIIPFVSKFPIHLWIINNRIMDRLLK